MPPLSDASSPASLNRLAQLLSQDALATLRQLAASPAYHDATGDDRFDLDASAAETIEPLYSARGVRERLERVVGEVRNCRGHEARKGADLNSDPNTGSVPDLDRRRLPQDRSRRYRNRVPRAEHTIQGGPTPRPQPEPIGEGGGRARTQGRQQDAQQGVRAPDQGRGSPRGRGVQEEASLDCGRR